MPRVAVWKTKDLNLKSPLITNAKSADGAGAKSTHAEDEAEEIGGGLGLFARTSAQRLEQERVKRAEQEAEERAKAKDRAVARAVDCKVQSHEMQDGANAMGGYSQGLSLNYSGQPTTYNPNDDEFLYRKATRTVALKSVANEVASTTAGLQSTHGGSFQTDLNVLLPSHHTQPTAELLKDLLSRSATAPTTPHKGGLAARGSENLPPAVLHKDQKVRVRARLCGMCCGEGKDKGGVLPYANQPNTGVPGLYI